MDIYYAENNYAESKYNAENNFEVPSREPRATKEPRQPKHVINAIRLYRGRVVGEDIEDEIDDNADSPRKLRSLTRAFTKYEGLIKKYKGEDSVLIANCIGYLAREKPDKLDSAASTIGKFEGRGARIAAEYILEAAMENPHALECVIYGIGSLAGTINSLDNESKNTAINLIAKTAVGKPSALKQLGDLIGRCDSKSFSDVEELVLDILENEPNELSRVIKAVAKYSGEPLGDAARYLYTLSEDGNTKDVAAAFSTLADPEEFINYQRKQLKAPDAFFRFKRSYLLTDSGSAVEANEEANKLLYERGLQIVNGIRSGSIGLNPNVEMLCGDEHLYKEVIAGIETAKVMKQRLKKSQGANKKAREWLKRYGGKERELRAQAMEKIKDGLKDTYELPELKKLLLQLSQHHLKGEPSKTAAQISNSLIVTEGDLDSNVMELSVWQKSLSDQPTFKEYKCCEFKRCKTGGNDDIARYIINPAIQMVRLRIGDKTAMAITASTTNRQGRKVMLVDSFESKSHIFARKEVSDAALEGLKAYARESGFDELFVSSSVANNAPQEFYSTINGQVTKRRLKLDGKIVDVELESYRDRDTSEGKLFKLNKTTS